MQLTANELQLISCLRKIKEFQSLLADSQPAYNGEQEHRESYNYLSRLEQLAPNIVEEANELSGAVSEVNDIDVIDGIGDVLFTALQLLDAGDHGGYKVLQALELICDNNLTKFLDDTEAGFLQAVYSQEAYKLENIDIRVLKRQGKLLLLDQNGKVRKPLSYRSVNLKSCIPTHKGGI